MDNKSEISFHRFNKGLVIERGTYFGNEESVECSAYCSINFHEDLFRALDKYFVEQKMKANYRFGNTDPETNPDTTKNNIDPDTTKNNLEIRFFESQPTEAQRWAIGDII
jgi:hypothetical protein